MSLVDCSKVYVKKCDYGYGVYAKQNFNKNDLIESSLIYPLYNIDGNENPHVFYSNNTEQLWYGGSGCLPYYNHSNNPNIEKIIDIQNNKMNVYALCDINKDEELFTKYNSILWRKCFASFNK
jgi:hypothetical protein